MWYNNYNSKKCRVQESTEEKVNLCASIYDVRKGFGEEVPFDPGLKN